MKTRILCNLVTACLTAAGLAWTAESVFGQAPVIRSLSQNGQLVCTSLQPGSTATVEWASSLEGPWTNNWVGLKSVTADASGTIRVSVPMFYRVRGVPPPAGMVLVPPGSFTMGDAFSEGNSDERPTHTAYVSGFYMDQYEVTKELWDVVRAWNGGNGYTDLSAGLHKAANHPVYSITWYDCVKWCNARSQMKGRTPCYYTDAALTMIYKTGEGAVHVKWSADGYRLPTEAEWEKAARGGAVGRRFPWSSTDEITHTLANYNSSATYGYDTSSSRGYHPAFAVGGQPYTSPVGHFSGNANGYGLHDMAGNVDEWCWDWYGLYSAGSVTDPRGPTTGSYRVIRDGGWYGSASACRTASRRSLGPALRYLNVGFRCVLPSDQP